MSTSPPILSLHDVSKRFGGILAVDGVSFDVAAGSITGLIGPNGAGKTTLFNLISGFHHPDSGEIIFQGERINGLPLHRTFQKGLCRTFQISRELKKMTVLENLLLVPPGQLGERLWASWFLPRRVKRQEEAIRDRALDIIERLGLGPLRDEYAGNLAGGQKRLLDLGRAMIAGAKLVLLDEPGAGVNPGERRLLAEHIRRLVAEDGATVLLIGHEMELVMDICNPIIVMERGRKLAEGTAEQVRGDPRVLDVYLGREHR